MRLPEDNCMISMKSFSGTFARRPTFGFVREMVDSPNMPTLESRDQDQHTPSAPSAQPSSMDETKATDGSSFRNIARKVGLVVVLGAAAGFAYWKIQCYYKDTATT